MRIFIMLTAINIVIGTAANAQSAPENEARSALVAERLKVKDNSDQVKYGVIVRTIRSQREQAADETADAVVRLNMAVLELETTKKNLEAAKSEIEILKKSVEELKKASKEMIQ